MWSSFYYSWSTVSSTNPSPHTICGSVKILWPYSVRGIQDMFRTEQPLKKNRWAQTWPVMVVKIWRALIFALIVRRQNPAWRTTSSLTEPLKDWPNAMTDTARQWTTLVSRTSPDSIRSRQDSRNWRGTAGRIANQPRSNTLARTLVALWVAQKISLPPLLLKFELTFHLSWWRPSRMKKCLVLVFLIRTARRILHISRRHGTLVQLRRLTRAPENRRHVLTHCTLMPCANSVFSCAVK